MNKFFLTLNFRQEEILRTAENDLDVLREMQAEYNRRNPFQESVII